MTHGEILAYAAGLIDGEGCIRIAHTPGLRSYMASVSVGMCDREALDFLAEHFGGRVVPCSKDKRPNRRAVFRWGIYGKSAVAFLDEIHPFLMVKSQQAGLTIACGETGDYWQRHGVPERVLKIRHNLYQMVRELNKKGKRPAKGSVGEMEDEELSLEPKMEEPPSTPLEYEEI